MVKFNKLAMSAAIIAMSAGLFCGCGKKAEETTAAQAQTEAGATEAAATEANETEASESAAEDETMSEAQVQMTEDGEKIAALNPQKPENLGTVELGEYKGLVVEGPVEKTVTDADVQAYVEANILPYANKEVTEEAIQVGDTCNISYVGTKDGVAFEGGTGSYDLTIGSGAFIPGFEDGLIGKHFGETVELNLTFPEDYGNADLAGQDVVFTVDINKITRQITYDEFDDASVQKLTENPDMTVVQYISDIKKSLQENEANTAKSDLYMNAIDQVVANSTIEPSEDAINWQMDVYLENYNKSIAYQYGMDLASMLYMYGSTYDEFRESLKEAATDAATRVICEYAICEAEGLTYNEEARNEYFSEFGYDQEIVDQMITASEQEMAVIGNLACKAVIDNAKEVKYVEAAE